MGLGTRTGARSALGGEPRGIGQGMDATNESEFQVGGQARRHAAHHDSRRKSLVSRTEFEALATFAAPNTTSIELAKMLQRCTPAAIRHWCNGHRDPPKWAMIRLAEMAHERVRQLVAKGKINTPLGEQGARVLMAYMARRARERDAKKKLGSGATEL